MIGLRSFRIDLFPDDLIIQSRLIGQKKYDKDFEFKRLIFLRLKSWFI